MAKQLATIGQRVLAWIIDLIIITLIMGVLVAIGLGSLFLGGQTANPFAMLFGVTSLVSMFVIIFVYTILLEGMRQGQTVGKQVIRIRVVDEKSKKPINMTQSIIRNLLRIIDNQVIGLVGLILIAVTQKRQRIGDMLAKTVVVKN